MSAGRAAAAAALLACPPLAARGAEVYIGVEGPRGDAALPGVGLPPFGLARGAPAQDGERARLLREVLRADLAFSRRVRVVEPPSGEAAADPKGRSADWRAAGAGLAVSATLSSAETPAAAKGSAPARRLSLTAALLDLGSGQALFERTYRQEERHWRAVAHAAADDVVLQLTGRRGIARTRLAFVNDATGSKELCVADYDGEGFKRLSSDGSIALLPRWRPGGTAVAFTSYRKGNPDLFELDLETGRLRVILDRQGLNLAGGFSPDGSRLVVTQSRERTPNVYLLDLADGSMKALTAHFGVDSSPTFSPDGGQVAFVSDRSGNPEVHVLDLAAGRTRRLTRMNWCDSPAWSPTGEWIAFAGRANPKDKVDLFLVDVTGSHLRQLTHGEGSNEDPAWSPDGRFIAFTSNRGGRRRLFVMDADGSAPRIVGDLPGASFTPSWSQ